MHRVYLGLGSNIDAPLHIGLALQALEGDFGPLDQSQVYESEAVGFAGDNFLNLVVGFDTELDLASLARRLKALEARHGRTPQAPRFSARTLDIDILTFGDWVGEFGGIRLPRPEILENAFVLRPLAELAGQRVHPQTGKSYASHWQAYDRPQQLWPVPFPGPKATSPSRVR